jgi:hypothetical protein
VTFALARSLLLADAVTPQALAQALLMSATRGMSLVRALLATRAIDAMRLEQLLERGDAPYMRHVAPVMSLVQPLPPGLCERLLALPVRRDPRTGTIDVAVVDARDSHPVEEMAHWLKAPVRMVRTSLAAMDAALRRVHEKHEAGMRPLAAPIWVPSATEPRPDLPRTPAYGSPAVEASSSPAADEADEADESSMNGELQPTAHDPDIPIPLMRKSLASVTVSDLGPPAVERGVPADVEPVLELRSRRPAGAASAIGPQAREGAPETEPVLDLRKRKSLHSVPPSAPPSPFEDVGPRLDAIRAAPDRDTILEEVVLAVRTIARKVGVMAVRRDALVGWSCTAEFAERTTFRAARLPMTMSGVLGVALASPSAELARIPKDGTHAPLLAAMISPPAREVGMVAIRVDSKPVALVLADDMDDALVGAQRLELVARVAGQSLARLLRERRK